ncbi:MAG: flagellar biosynthetic protein FliR [Lachnospiraceae bacterium]|nr:flagellar biosynthetic protein FliR [Lachnospiraceae bacterium]
MNDYTNFIFLSLVFMRMSGFVLLNPIFARQNVPVQVKTGLVIALTVIVYTATPIPDIMPATFLEYGVLLLKEFAAGYVIGFIITLFAYVIIFAGDFLDMEMGISMSKIYDAQSNSSISLSSTFYNTMYMLLFFAIDAHVALINILITSHKVVPYGSVTFGQELTQSILDMFVMCTEFAVKMAFPVVAIEFLCTVGMGILMKAIPQINIFVVNIQLKIFVGLCLMLMLFTPMADFVQQLILVMMEHLRNALQLLV